VDFLLHLGDGAPPGLPLVQVNINRSSAQAGFTLPKYMWRDALGPAQFQVLAECLQVTRCCWAARSAQQWGWNSLRQTSCHCAVVTCGWVAGYEMSCACMLHCAVLICCASQLDACRLLMMYC
jgi:hypothetical protein